MPENDTWKIWGARVQVLVSSHSTAGRYTICRVEAAAGEGAPLHTHRYEDEFFHILEGAFQFGIDGESVLATQGTSIFIPRETAHTFHNCGCEPGRFLVVAAPGGMDLFIRDLGEVALRPFAGLGQLAPILEKHGIDLPTRGPLDSA